MSIRLQRRPLRVADALDELDSPRWGGVVLFEGRVRSDPQPHGVVTALAYEADPPLARRVMRAIARETRQRYRVARTVLWHRVGTVKVGETAVIVGAAAAHRSAAFAAARSLIDRVKREVPLWKADRVRPGRRPRRSPRRRGARSSG